MIKVCADPQCEAVYHNAPSTPCHCEFCGIPLKRINEETYWKKFSNNFFQYDWETGDYYYPNRNSPQLELELKL